MEQIFAIVGPIQQSQQEIQHNQQEIQQEFQQNGERLDSLQAEIQAT
jgi:ABC-type phosphate transport system auxiliary subunit